MSLDEFLRLYEADDNEWWRLGSGDHQNLFEEAVERMRTAEADADRWHKVADLYHDRFGHAPSDAHRAHAAALRERDEREHYAATRDERITEILRERDELIPLESENERLRIATEVALAERGALRVRAETAVEYTATLLEILERIEDDGWVFDDDERVAIATISAAHAAAVEARP